MLYPYALPQAAGMVEVVDGHDRPLLLMPEAQAKAQGLSHRKVRVLLCDAVGRVFLARCLPPEGSPGPWALPTASVRAGEPREAAALRALEGAGGISGIALRAAEKKEALPHAPEIFLGILPKHAPAARPGEGCETLFLDSDELQGLAEHFPDLLAPELLRSLSSGYLDALLAECNRLHKS